jgi:hypothetical protein
MYPFCVALVQKCKRRQATPQPCCTYRSMYIARCVLMIESGGGGGLLWWWSGGGGLLHHPWSSGGGAFPTLQPTL